jgi:hypothetical protein
MKGPVLMREYCSISTFPMPQTTDSAKNRKPVAGGEEGGGEILLCCPRLNKKNPQRPGMA